MGCTWSQSTHFGEERISCHCQGLNPGLSSITQHNTIQKMFYTFRRCAKQNVQMLSCPHPGSSNGCCFTVIQCELLRVGLFSPTELSVLRDPKRWKLLGPILPPGFVTVCSTMAKHGPYCAQQFQCLRTFYEAAGRRVIANRC